MAGGLNVVEHLEEFSIGPDQEAHARDALEELSVHGLLFDDLVIARHLLLGVGEQRIGKIVFVFELLLLGWSVSGNAKYGKAGLLELCVCVAEPARLDRSTGSVRFRIEEEDERFPGEVAELHGFAVLVRQFKIRCFRAFFQHFGFLSERV